MTIDLEEVLYRGREFEFVCPDTFNEEYTVQRFMIVDIGQLGIIYSKGYNKGRLKWDKLPRKEGHHGITVGMLIQFLIDNYKPVPDVGWGYKFDPNTFKLVD